MTADGVLNLVSSALLALFGGVLWTIWAEIKGLRVSRHNHNNNLLWLNFHVGEITGEHYDPPSKG